MSSSWMESNLNINEETNLSVIISEDLKWKNSAVVQ